MEHFQHGDLDDTTNSPHTSPPSSVAPYDEDFEDFTSVLLQKAAKNLGVDYHPATQSSRPRSPAHQTHSPSLDHMTLHDLENMIHVREKALGPNHPSVANIHIHIAEKHVASRDSASRAENHYNMALNILEAHYGADAAELVPCISKLGNHYMSQSKFSMAKDMFRRAMMIAEHKGGLTQERLDAKETTAPDTSGRQNSLHGLLQELAANKQPPQGQETKRKVGEVLLSTWSQSVLEKRTEIDRRAAMTEIQCQTDPAEEDLDSQIPLSLPPPVSLSAEELERLRAPTFRTATDLKKLVNYVNRRADTSSANDFSVTSASTNISSIQTSEVLSPRSHAAEARARDLQRTIEQVKHRRQSSTAGHESYSPMDATEREVARLLMSNSAHDMSS